MKSNELVRKIKKGGWYKLREGKGSHAIYVHDEKPGFISVPEHGSKEVGKGLASKIMKQAGIR